MMTTSSIGFDYACESPDEHRNPQRLDASADLAQWCVSLSLLCETASPAPSFSQETPEQRTAYTPDVLRLCCAFIPNADEITTCLREKSAELSDACRTAIEAAMKQLPSVSDGTGARKRTAR
jgi:hypothetical protein